MEMIAGSGERRAVGLGEFAKMFGVSKDTAIRASRNGSLRTICIGARRLVPMSEISRVEREGLADNRTKSGVKKTR